MTSKTAIKTKEILLTRPPVVVVVGHVDHGKTSLLDYIRKTNVAAKEAGGITQATGAYEVEKNGKKITFIDTPGHEAFSAMRRRGAQVADVAILVVAADDGVKPQTKEAIEILKKTETPFIVALTKIDKNNADIERAARELGNVGVILEKYGGDISWHGVSNVTGEGIDDLLNLIALLGELEELTYNPSASGAGFVIEAHKDSRRGIVASCIIKDGALEVHDLIGTDSASCKVKIMEDFLGKRVKHAEPSAPVRILGWESIPKVGEIWEVGKVPGSKIEETQTRAEESKAGQVKVILKADVAGSLEALRELVSANVQVLDASVGEITSGDIKTAINTGSIILGFGSELDRATENLARVHNIKIITNKIIYKLIEDLDAYIKGESGPAARGELKVLKVFSVKGKKQVVGCGVVSGVVQNNSDVDIYRGEDKVGEGKIINLQKKKADAREVKEGECGIMLDSTFMVQPDDIIKVY